MRHAARSTAAARCPFFRGHAGQALYAMAVLGLLPCAGTWAAEDAGPTKVIVALGEEGELLLEYEVMVPVTETRVVKEVGTDGVVREVEVQVTLLRREVRTRICPRFEVSQVAGMKVESDDFLKAIKGKRLPALLIQGKQVSDRDRLFFRSDLYVIRELPAEVAP